MQVGDHSPKTMPVEQESRVQAQKKLVEQLKGEWKQLWSERFNDKVRAEDISVAEYQALHVEKGTIIRASRDYKPLNFKEILTEHMVENPERYLQPEAHVGGWSKFVKTNITSQKLQSKRNAQDNLPKKRENQQPKKGGRGWLHKK